MLHIFIVFFDINTINWSHYFNSGQIVIICFDEKSLTTTKKSTGKTLIVFQNSNKSLKIDIVIWIESVLCRCFSDLNPSTMTNKLSKSNQTFFNEFLPKWFQKRFSPPKKTHIKNSTHFLDRTQNLKDDVQKHINIYGAKWTQ